MKRRYKPYRAEGEESTLVKIAVGVGFLLLLAIAGFVIYLYVSKSRAVAELDPDTFCPKNGPASVTAVLVDRTDGINEVQAEALKALFMTWIEGVPEHGAFRVYEVAGGSGMPSPVLSVCNPGNVENVNVFTGNERLTRQRYEAKFRGPIEKLLADMLTDEEAQTSPIMEAVQAIAIRDFGAGRAKEERKLIVVSDLMQHTPEFSLYKAPPDIQGFRKSPYGRKIESDLSDVETTVYLLHSSSAKQTRDVVQFWLDWLMFQRADLQGQFKVPG
jgi:hypothetical protein